MEKEQAHWKFIRMYLSAYLPYEVRYWDRLEEEEFELELNCISDVWNETTKIERCLLFLQPLENFKNINSQSFTEMGCDLDIQIEISEFANSHKSLHHLSYGAFVELLKAHVDVFKLIPKGLAIIKGQRTSKP